MLLCTPGVCLANRPRLTAALSGIAFPAGQRGPFGADRNRSKRITARRKRAEAVLRLKAFTAKSIALFISSD